METKKRIASIMRGAGTVIDVGGTQHVRVSFVRRSPAQDALYIAADLKKTRDDLERAARVIVRNHAG